MAVLYLLAGARRRPHEAAGPGGRVVDPESGIWMAPSRCSSKTVRCAGGREGQGHSRARSPATPRVVVTPGGSTCMCTCASLGRSTRRRFAPAPCAAAAGFHLGRVHAQHDSAERQSVGDRAHHESRRGRARFARVYPDRCGQQGQKGEELAEIGDMVAAGAVAISDDGYPVKNAELMRRALLYAQHYDIPGIQHAQDMDLTGRWSDARRGVVDSAGSDRDSRIG